MADKLLSADGRDLVLVDLAGAKNMASREAHSVYLNKFDAYKLFTAQDQAERASRTASLARLAGVPIARATKTAYPAILEQDNGSRTRTRTNVYVLESERHIGDFFQLSKPGQITILVNRLRSSRPENKKRALRAFEAAKAFRLTDPQGFCDFTLGMPIRFFDVHQGTHAAPQIQQIIDSLTDD